MSKAFRFGVEALQELITGVSILARAVKVTLGPKGRNAVLDKAYALVLACRALRCIIAHELLTLVKLHDIHHYGNCNYGICFFMMDKIFGTYREDFPVSADGNRVKLNVFKSYPYQRGEDGKARKV